LTAISKLCECSALAQLLDAQHPLFGFNALDWSQLEETIAVQIKGFA
jgi:hypothetical protein